MQTPLSNSPIDVNSIAETNLTPTSLLRQRAAHLFKIIALLCAVAAILAAAKFAMGSYTFLSVQREFLDASPNASGVMLANAVDKPFLLALGLSFCAWKAWQLASRKTIGKVPRESAKTHTPLTLAAIRGLAFSMYLCVALLATEVVNALLAAVLINFTERAYFAHTHFDSDYFHELYLWLPIGKAIILSVLCIVICAARAYLAGRRNPS